MNNFKNPIKPAYTCKYFLFLMFALTAHIPQAQDLAINRMPSDSISESNIFNMSLEQMMNVKIVSASRKEEKSFESPVSTFVVTKKDIEITGATSIPEALRLCPGLIVRENSAGSYDVSVRGGVDGVSTYEYVVQNNTLLVMVDYRPVFNYFQGGTYWQNLPVDILDIERIEVVFGPVSPMYGPNAVQGAINLITRQSDKNGLNVHGNNVLFGTPLNTSINNLRLGYKFNDKFQVNVSGNYTYRQRHVEDYYNRFSNTFVDTIPQSDADKNRDFPKPNIGFQKSSLNASMIYSPKEDVNLMVNYGYNDSYAMSAFNTSGPLSVLVNNSHNFYARAFVKGFTFQSSVLYGVQGITGNIDKFKYNYLNFENYADYEFKFKGLSIRPSISYSNARINDKKYTVDVNQVGIFNNAANMANYAGGLKLDYTFSKFRAIAAIRADKFTYPDKIFTSYQLALNYKINDNNIVRFNHSTAYRGSYIATVFVDYQTANIPPSGSIPFPTIIKLKGNYDGDLLKNTIYEVGYKGNYGGKVVLDVSLFRQQFEGFQPIAFQPAVVDLDKGEIRIDIKPTSVPTKAIQYGTSVSLQANFFDNKLQVRPFATYQVTNIQQFTPYRAVENPDPTLESLGYNLKKEEVVDTAKYTPSIFGGVVINAIPIEKLSISLSTYHYSDYMLTSIETSDRQPYINPFTPDRPNLHNITAKNIVNLKVSYLVYKGLSLYANGRNILNDRGRESVGTDIIGSTYLLGVNYQY